MTRILDDEEKEELKEFFDSCDKDKNGRIQLSEFADLMKNLGEDVSGDEIRVGFSEIDKDGDGTIAFDEFLHYWENH